MEQWQTQTGRRRDLEETMLELNPYLGAIGTEILPVNNVASKTGTLYYQVLQSDQTAQTNRVITAAPTRTNITETSTTFSVIERIRGFTIPRSTVKTQFGTIERADRVGARLALRSVMRSHEADVAAAVLANGTAPVADILDSFVVAAQTGLKTIRRYAGQKALVMSHTVFNRVMRYTEITGRFGLASAVLGGDAAAQVLAREPQALMLLLRAIIGVDRVLIGDDDIWYDGSAGYQERAALVVLPDPSDMSEFEGPVFGKTYRYLPDDALYPFTIESHFNDDNKLNVYDAELHDAIKVLNPQALYILDGIDEGNAVTTTTTTTTAG